MISPLLMFLETFAVWTAGGLAIGAIDHFSKNSASTTRDLSGEQPQPKMRYRFITRLIAVAMVIYPPFVIYREVYGLRSEQWGSSNVSSCKVRIGPYERTC